MDDFKRELTRAGRKEARKVARKCRKLLKDVEAFYTSPLLRAVETAEIFHHFHKKAPVEFVVSLDSMLSVDSFLTEMKSFKEKCACFVGHEPLLSQIITELTGNDRFVLDKSGIAILESIDNEFALTFLASPSLLSK